ncbi:hypothetical protein DMH08_13885 [Actinomadura sp. WAC 06369]|nr:hypothetical protein DMH08_13885 [Actinomadura sp. WAC 06369]
MTRHVPSLRTSRMSRCEPSTRRVPAELRTSESITTIARAVDSSTSPRYTARTVADASALSFVITPSSPPVNATSYVFAKSSDASESTRFRASCKCSWS